MKDAFIVCTDGLKGFPEAIEAVFPSTLVQTCIVHLIRASLAYVNWKERKAMAADLKLIYRAATAEMAELALAEFRRKIPEAPGGSRCLATKLAAGHSVLRFPGRDPQDHLHDQRRGIAAHDAAEGQPESRIVSDPGGRDQVALSGTAERFKKVAHRPELARGTQPVQHPLARTNAARPGRLKKRIPLKGGRKSACGSKEFGSPLSRFPLRGKAGAGRVPPTPTHDARPATALARIVRRLPPQEGCRPLVYPLRAR